MGMAISMLELTHVLQSVKEGLKVWTEVDLCSIVGHEEEQRKHHQSQQAVYWYHTATCHVKAIQFQVIITNRRNLKHIIFAQSIANRDNNAQSEEYRVEYHQSFSRIETDKLCVLFELVSDHEH